MTELALPQDWSSKRLKYLATYNDEVLAESTDEEKEIDYVEISGVSLSHGIEEIERMSFRQAPARARRKVRSGDILISTVRTYLRAIAKVDEASPDLIASTGFCVVRPNDDVDSGFLGWAAKSEPFVSEVVARSVGVSYPAINASELVSMYIPLPPLDTQKRIARFLDEKTDRIDGLITKKRELLDRLAEKRQALITRAVTKGLNPDAPMKPSGINWLGDIPAHWEVKRLRFLLNGGTLNGLYKTKEEFDPEGIPFVQMGEAFRSPVFDGGTKDCVNATKDEIEKWCLLNGDFLVARRSIVFEGSGKSVLVYGLEGPHLFESSMIRIRPQNPQEHSKYLSFYFQSHIGRESILSMTKRVTISGIDSQQLKSIHVPIPPNSETRDIAARCETCDRNTQHIEREISSSIERLVEYRFTLVTAAVTGQVADLQ